MADHNDLGHKGEDLAKEHLLRKEYKIKATNWRYGREEIDIIAEKDSTLIIVEVKTRSAKYLQAPRESVGKNKQRFLISAADAYITRNQIDLETRFDIIEVIIDNKQFELNHIEEAFSPSFF